MKGTPDEDQLVTVIILDWWARRSGRPVRFHRRRVTDSPTSSVCGADSKIPRYHHGRTFLPLDLARQVASPCARCYD